ncbi:MAG: chorismate mutase [Candidatus Gastranaerophilales bacterium]|nr:chorismate mutase [Candidatus Gastranaerophilales bacterium]
MDIVSIRGAITADNNTIKDITDATVELCKEILDKNNIKTDDIVNIIFSMTKDLNAVYPAKALREKFDVKDIPLFCTQEADIQDSLSMCIRVLITVKSSLNKSEVKHIYLKEAKKLRPDLLK